MTEQELRAMVRDSIARQLGDTAFAETVRLKPDTTSDVGSVRLQPDVITSDVGSVRLQPDLTRNAAFVRLAILSGGDDDGACLIEPAVRCNHCGYCQSFGH